MTLTWGQQKLGFRLPRLIKTPLDWTLIAAYMSLGTGRRFAFEGRQLNYFYHHYNNAALNERTIEVPIVEQFLRPGDKVLEVGNVFNHYRPFPHVVVDKYEIAPGVLNCDVVEYTSVSSYDFIFSISSIEHVGLDEPLKEPEKSIRATSNLKSLLAQSGTMLITVPGGYNSYLDEIIEA